jgi:predicted N-acetyltransferase YhbS
MVHPDYQGRRIGSAIMETAMAELRRRARPGSYVGLFTGKPDFYKRFGFGSGAGMSLIL